MVVLECVFLSQEKKTMRVAANVPSPADLEILGYLLGCYSCPLGVVAQAAQAELAALRAELETVSDPDYARLAAWRLLASNSLAARNSQGRVGWDRANNEIAQRLAAGTPLAIATATPLHAALEVGTSAYRRTRLYTADEEYLSPDSLPEALETLDAALTHADTPALYRAFYAYVGIVTCHPFENGNGRTARLLADAYLLSDGYLPLCFASPITSHVAQTHGGVARDVEQAFATFLEGVLCAYRVVLRKRARA
jgi:hypothetical protein